jgi:hypothetical protein
MNNRRQFLQGLAATLALPSFESLGSVVGKTLPTHPNRLGFIYVPNGVNVDTWWPSGTGRNFQWSESLASLADFKDDLSILRHLDHEKAFANGDGAGDHARANATFLTGC